MKNLLLGAIWVYWKVIPERYRRECLFEVSCSHFVYEKAQEEGLRAGLQALIYRYRSCRPGSIVYRNPVSGEPERMLVTGEVIPAAPSAHLFI